MIMHDLAPRAARLDLARDHGLVMPEGALLLHPRAGEETGLPAPVVVTPHAMDAAWFKGGAEWPHIGTPLPGAVICLPRSRIEAQDVIARANDACQPGAPVVIDGQKSDGIEAVLRALRGVVAVSEPISKGHGKIAWFPAQPGALAAWRSGPGVVSDEGRTWQTMPGVFSADAIDPASRLLAGALPALSGAGADLGAGWGYLSAHVLTSPKVTALHLVESDARALDCARANVVDPRAVFHWADATATGLTGLSALDFVVMNPPFHAGRAAVPALGVAFIRAAAAMLRGSGTLWLVANRHLPYETALGDIFAEVVDMGGAPGFKILSARHPRTRAPQTRTPVRRR